MCDFHHSHQNKAGTWSEMHRADLTRSHRKWRLFAEQSKQLLEVHVRNQSAPVMLSTVWGRNSTAFENVNFGQGDSSAEYIKRIDGAFHPSSRINSCNPSSTVCVQQEKKGATRGHNSGSRLCTYACPRIPTNQKVFPDAEQGRQ